MALAVMTDAEERTQSSDLQPRHHDPDMRQEPWAQGSGRQLTSISVTLEVPLLHYRPAYLKQTNRP